MSNYYTLADMARELNFSKPYIAGVAKDLGIYDELQVIDSRGTRALNAEQASLVSHEIEKRRKAKGSDAVVARLDDEAESHKLEAARQEVMDNLRETIEQQKAIIEQLNGTIAQMNANHDAEIYRLKVEIDAWKERAATFEAKANSLQMCVTELAGAWPWKKRAIIQRYAALPPAE